MALLLDLPVTSAPRATWESAPTRSRELGLRRLRIFLKLPWLRQCWCACSLSSPWQTATHSLTLQPKSPGEGYFWSTPPLLEVPPPQAKRRVHGAKLGLGWEASPKRTYANSAAPALFQRGILLITPASPQFETSDAATCSGGLARRFVAAIGKRAAMSNRSLLHRPAKGKISSIGLPL